MTFLNEGPKVDRRLLFKSLITPSKLLSTVLKRDVTVLYCSCRGRSVIDSEDLETFIRDAGVDEVISHDRLCSLEGMEFYRNVLSRFPKKLVVLACSRGHFKDAADEVGYPLENLHVLELQELCGLVHDEPLKATEKAKRMTASFLAQNFSRSQIEGGGIVLARSKGLDARDVRTLYGRLDYCLSFKGACSSCMSYCPRKAVSKNLSTLVDRRLCDVCGVCESVCLEDVFYILPAKPDFGLGLEFLLKESWRGLGVKRGKEILEDKVVVFACEREVKNAFVKVAVGGERYREELLPLFLPCLSTVTVNLVLQAFSEGAEGVILVGCQSCKPEIKSYVEDVVMACKSISSKFIDKVECFWVRGNDVRGLIDGLEEGFRRAVTLKFEVKGDDKSYDGKRDEIVGLIRSLSDKDVISSSKLLPFGFIDVKEGCNMCGKCVDACPTQALTTLRGHIYFDHAKCVGCGICEKACENSFIKCYQEIRPAFLGKSIKVV